MKQKTLKQAYLANKEKERVLLESVLQEAGFTTDQLLENSDILKEIGIAFSHLKEMALVLKSKAPEFYSYANILEEKLTAESLEEKFETVNELNFFTRFLSEKVFCNENLDVVSEFENAGGSVWLVGNPELESALRSFEKLTTNHRQLVSENTLEIPKILLPEEEKMISDAILLERNLEKRLFINEAGPGPLGGGLLGGLGGFAMGGPVGGLAGAYAGAKAGAKATEVAERVPEIDYEALYDAITNIEEIVKRLGPPDTFRRVKAGIAKLQDQLEQVVTAQGGLLHNIKGMLGLNPQAKDVLKTSMIAVDLFRSLATKWPVVEKVLMRALKQIEASGIKQAGPDGKPINPLKGLTGITEDAKSSAEATPAVDNAAALGKVRQAILNILKSANPGTKGWIASLFGGAAKYPEGLSPADFAEDIIDIIKSPDRGAAEKPVTEGKMTIVSEGIKDLQIIMRNFAANANKIETLNDIATSGDSQKTDGKPQVPELDLSKAKQPTQTTSAPPAAPQQPTQTPVQGPGLVIPQPVPELEPPVPLVTKKQTPVQPPTVATQPVAPTTQTASVSPASPPAVATQPVQSSSSALAQRIRQTQAAQAAASAAANKQQFVVPRGDSGVIPPATKQTD